MSRKKNIQRLLVEHQRYLQKLQEIQARKGVNTEPHILLEIEDREEEIRKLQAELAALPAGKEPAFAPVWLESMTDRFRQWPRLVQWLIPVGVLLVVGAGVWTVLEFPDGPPPTAVSEICLPSPEPVRVAVAQLPNCSPDSQTQLVNLWNTGVESEAIAVPQFFANGAAARKLDDYDLVVWGVCSPAESDSITLNYELITTRKPDEIAEPFTLVITGTLDTQVELGRGLVGYQHGDYATAARQFGGLPAAGTVPEVALLWGNSLLFAGQYEAAISSYQTIISTLKSDWPAVHNNLGVAKFNKDLLDVDGFPQSGRDSFDRAIELAQAQGDSQIELLATVNQSDLLRRVGNWNTAAASCEVARGIDSRSPYPYLCQVLVDFSAGAGSSQDIPFYKIDRDLATVERLDNSMPRLYFLRASWYREQNQRQEAIAAYERFLELMKYRACLQVDLNYINDANHFRQALQN